MTAASDSAPMMTVSSIGIEPSRLLDGTSAAASGTAATAAASGAAFDGAYLWKKSRGRSVAVKTFLMDQKIVVGVGNIYAAEALFAAGIHPRRVAGSVASARYERLAGEVKRILTHAIARGGTTLRDFISPDGAPGYFEQELYVYGRAGEPCKVCATPIRVVVLGQRSTFYCPRCQR